MSLKFWSADSEINWVYYKWFKSGFYWKFSFINMPFCSTNSFTNICCSSTPKISSLTIHHDQNLLFQKSDFLKLSILEKKCSDENWRYVRYWFLDWRRARERIPVPNHGRANGARSLKRVLEISSNSQIIRACLVMHVYQNWEAPNAFINESKFINFAVGVTNDGQLWPGLIGLRVNNALLQDWDDPDRRLGVSGRFKSEQL